METHLINKQLQQGEIDHPGMFPHVDALKNAAYIFSMDFGLPELPTEPGILPIRGARQYGKSTWLEQQICNTIKKFGPGSAFYLNGEYIADNKILEQEIESLLPSFSSAAAIKRIFIDEITSIPKWEITLKRLADKRKFKDILVITTGSSAGDLRRGSERLPGRKGKLARTTYLFTPVSYKEFHRVCSAKLKNNTLKAYLISGGSPIACSELAENGVIPEYVIELVRDWIEGEITRTGRNRTSLYNLLNVLFRFGVSTIGQAKLAREAGLANNTVAAGYIETLSDLSCIVPTYSWDQHRKIAILRKPCKYHFINVLAAIAYHPARIRSPNDFDRLPTNEQGVWIEWLVAQELQRQAAIQGKELLSPLLYWNNKEHEIDFVQTPNDFLEVKLGKCAAFEFSWFNKHFPGKKLTVINTNQFSTEFINGVTLEDFLGG